MHIPRNYYLNSKNSIYYRYYTIVSPITDGAPPDGTPISIIHTYHIAEVVVFYVLALCGVVVTIIILILFIAGRGIGSTITLWL